MGLNDDGTPIPIHYGAKLTGQVDNWNIGMLHMNDARETGINNFSVARVTRNIGKQSSAGFIGTYGNTQGAEQNLLTGLDLKLSTSTFQGNKNASLFLFGLQSDTKNTHGKNTAWGTQFVYPNDLIFARLGHHQIGENFITGMGFVPRTNIRETYAQLTLARGPTSGESCRLFLAGSSITSPTWKRVNWKPVKLKSNHWESGSFPANKSVSRLSTNTICS
jgi:hypothetical protein